MATAIAAAAMPAADALAASAVLAGNVLTVTGDATNDTFTVTDSGGNIRISSSVDLPDPDGGGANCADEGTTAVTCTNASTTSVHIKGGAGNDSITDARGSNNDTFVGDGEADDDTITVTGPAYAAARNLKPAGPATTP